jgi:hypothetical protein
MQACSNLIWNILKTSSPLEKQEKENGDVNGRYSYVPYNTLKIATEYNNAMSQTPAIYGHSNFILQVPLSK